MLEKVRDILSEYTDMKREEMVESSDLLADMELNSLDIVNVIMAIEDEFNIEIPDRDIKDLTTIGNIVEYLEKNV